jgi:hypothetical protein
MVVRTRFDIDQTVGIIALKNYPANIHQIRIDGKNLFYDLDYWVDKELKVCSVSEHEISEEYSEVL